MSGFLNALLRAAPGIAAQGLAGQNQGRQVAQQQERQAGQDRFARAMAEFNMNNVTEDNARERQQLDLQERYRRDALNQAAQDKIDARAFQEALAKQNAERELARQKEMAHLVASLRPPQQQQQWEAVNHRVQQLVAGGMPLDKASAQARLEFGEAPPSTGAGGRGTMLNASTTKDLSGYQDMLNDIDAALGSLDQAAQEGKGTMVVGPVASGVHKLRQFTQTTDPTIASARGNISRVNTMERHKVLGAAMTTQELKQTQEYLAMLDSSDETTVKVGLQGLKRVYAHSFNNRLQMEQAAGRHTGTIAPIGQASTPPTISSVADAFDAWVQQNQGHP